LTWKYLFYYFEPKIKNLILIFVDILFIEWIGLKVWGTKIIIEFLFNYKSFNDCEYNTFLFDIILRVFAI
jgi:hypothetical protein